MRVTTPPVDWPLNQYWGQLLEQVEPDPVLVLTVFSALQVNAGQPMNRTTIIHWSLMDITEMPVLQLTHYCNTITRSTRQCSNHTCSHKHARTHTHKPMHIHTHLLLEYIATALEDLHKKTMLNHIFPYNTCCVFGKKSTLEPQVTSTGTSPLWSPRSVVYRKK